MSYTAIIVEPRKHLALEFVLTNVLTNLSDEWNVIVCCGNKNSEFVLDIVSNKLPSHFVKRVTCIKMNVDNLTKKQYSHLLVQSWFYEIIPTETFLIFQTDSMILSKNKDKINQFLHYDYVGAPWHVVNIPVAGQQVGNGGFSLRKKSKMLEIIATDPYNTYAEDVYFCYHPTIHLEKPDFEKAKEFSVESVFYTHPFACHSPWNLHAVERQAFFSLYPEALELYNLNRAMQN
jgi:hypothetical protein